MKDTCLKIRVSLSNPRFTRSNIREKISSKHQIEAISLVKEEATDLEGDEEKTKQRFFQTNKDKYSIVISLYYFVMHLFIFSYCIMHDRMFALVTEYY